jgi:hypothetical protein
LLFDIFDDDKPIGCLVLELKTLRATITIGIETYTSERIGDRQDERLYQALIRVMWGGEKPPANPWTLKDIKGQTLALAEPIKQGFAIGRDGEGFVFRKRGRLYCLSREGSDLPLGSVGQEKFFTTTLHMRLSADFDARFQIFLLTLMLSLTMQNLEKSSNSSA